MKVLQDWGAPQAWTKRRIGLAAESCRAGMCLLHDLATLLLLPQELHRVLRPGCSVAILDFNNAADNPVVDATQAGGREGAATSGSTQGVEVPAVTGRSPHLPAASSLLQAQLYTPAPWPLSPLRRRSFWRAWWCPQPAPWAWPRSTSEPLCRLVLCSAASCQSNRRPGLAAPGPCICSAWRGPLPLKPQHHEVTRRHGPCLCAGTCAPPSSDSPAGRSRRCWHGRPVLRRPSTTPLHLASWAAWCAQRHEPEIPVKCKLATTGASSATHAAGATTICLTAHSSNCLPRRCVTRLEKVHTAKQRLGVRLKRSS